MSAPKSDTDPTPGGTVSLEDAARALGVSRRTIERRLAKGELSGERQGKGWRVHLPEAAPSEADTLRARVDELTATVEHLTRELSEGDRDLAHAREIIGRLERDLEDARGERDDWKNALAGVVSRLPPQLPERAESHPETRPWWQLWRRP